MGQEADKWAHGQKEHSFRKNALQHCLLVQGETNKSVSIGRVSISFLIANLFLQTACKLNLLSTKSLMRLLVDQELVILLILVTLVATGVASGVISWILFTSSGAQMQRASLLCNKSSQLLGSYMISLSSCFLLLGPLSLGMYFHVLAQSNQIQRINRIVEVFLVIGIVPAMLAVGFMMVYPVLGISVVRSKDLLACSNRFPIAIIASSLCYTLVSEVIIKDVTVSTTLDSTVLILNISQALIVALGIFVSYRNTIFYSSNTSLLVPFGLYLVLMTTIISMVWTGMSIGHKKETIIVFYVLVAAGYRVIVNLRSRNIVQEKKHLLPTTSAILKALDTYYDQRKGDLSDTVFTLTVNSAVVYETRNKTLTTLMRDSPRERRTEEVMNTDVEKDRMVIEDTQANSSSKKGRQIDVNVNYIIHLFSRAFNDSSTFNIELAMHYASFLIDQGTNLLNLGMTLKKLKTHAKDFSSQLIHARLELMASLMLRARETGQISKEGLTMSESPAESSAAKGEETSSSENLDIFKPVEAITKYEHLVDIMNSQIARILDFYDQLELPLAWISKIHEIVRTIYNQRDVCDSLFKEVDQASGPHQTFHLLPYALFVELTENNHELGKELVRNFDSKMSCREKYANGRGLGTKLVQSTLLDNSLSLVVEAQKPNLGMIVFTSKNLETAFGEDLPQLEGKNLDMFFRDDMAKAHANEVENFISCLDKEEYLGKKHLRFVTFDGSVYFKAVVVVRFVPQVDEGFRFVVLLKNIPFEQNEMLFVIKPDKCIVGTNIGTTPIQSQFSPSRMFVGLSLEDISEEAAKAVESYLQFLRKGNLGQAVISRAPHLKDKSKEQESTEKEKYQDLGEELISPKELFENLGVEVKIIATGTGLSHKKSIASDVTQDGEVARMHLHWVRVGISPGVGFVIMKLGSGFGEFHRAREISNWMRMTMTPTFRNSKTAVKKWDSNTHSLYKVPKLQSLNKPLPLQPSRGSLMPVKESDLLNSASAVSNHEEDIDRGLLHSITNRASSPISISITKVGGNLYYDPLTNSKGIIKPKGNSRASVTLNRDTKSGMLKKVLKKGGDIDRQSEASTRTSVLSRKQMLIILQKRNSTSRTGWLTILISAIYWGGMFAMIMAMQSMFNSTFNSIEQSQEVLGYIVSLDSYFKSAVTNNLDEKLTPEYGFSPDRYAAYNPVLTDIQATSSREFDFHLGKARENFENLLVNLQDLSSSQVRTFYSLGYLTMNKVPSVNMTEVPGEVGEIGMDFPQTIEATLFDLVTWRSSNKDIRTWAALAYYDNGIKAWADLMDQTFQSFNDQELSTIQTLVTTSTVSSILGGVCLLVLIFSLGYPAFRAKNKIMKLYQIFEMLKDFEIALKKIWLQDLSSQLHSSLAREREFVGWFMENRNHMAEYQQYMMDQTRKSNKGRKVRLSTTEWFGSGKALIFHSLLMLGMLIMGSTIVIKQQSSAHDYTNWLAVNKDYLESIFSLNNLGILIYIDNSGDVGLLNYIPNLHNFIYKYHTQVVAATKSLLDRIRGMDASTKLLGYQKFFQPPCDLLDLSVYNLSKQACENLGSGSIQGDYIRFFQTSMFNMEEVYRIFHLEIELNYHTIMKQEFMQFTYENRVIHRPFFELVKADLQRSSKLVNQNSEKYITWVGQYLFWSIVGIYIATCVFWLRMTNKETEICLSVFLIIPTESLTENTIVRNTILRATF